MVRKIGPTVDSHGLQRRFCPPALRPIPHIHDSTENDIVFIDDSARERGIAHSIFTAGRMVPLSIRTVPRPEIVDVQDLPGEAGGVLGEVIGLCFLREDILRPAELRDTYEKQDYPPS